MSPFTALISGIGSFFSQSEPGVGAAASLERIGAGLVNGAKVMFLTFTPVGWVIKGFTALKDFLAGIDLSAAGKAIIGTLVSGNDIKIYDWHGRRIRFSPRSFDHAFSESSDYRFGNGFHDRPLSKKRARCILWIKEALAASQGTIEVMSQYRRDTRGRNRKRRVILVVEERYVVIIQYRKNTGDYQFITAYVADERTILKIKSEGGWLETKKSPSLDGD